MANGSNVWSVWGRKSLSAAVLLGSLAASYVGVSLWQQHRGATAEADGEVDGPPVNPFASANGTHLIAFVITGSNCGWASQPTTMLAIGSIRARLQAAHGGSYAQVSVVGVAIDRDLGAGLRFLSDIGQGKPEGAFDQVVVGGSWLNEQIVRFVWREGIAEATSPQVLVVERPVDSGSYLETAKIAVQNDKVLVNPVGSTEIVSWINQGLPLDYVPLRELTLPAKPGA